jgi:outer membrane protein assembly factor BamB
VENCRFLFLNHADGRTSLEASAVKAKLPKSLYPTRIFWNLPLPTTANGKVDENGLTKYIHGYYAKHKEGCPCHTYGLLTQNNSRTLKSLGVSSLEAVELAFHFEQSGMGSLSSTELIQFFLNETTTVEDVLNLSHRTCATNDEKSDVPVVTVDVGNRLEAQLEWTHNLGKCIDATPVVSKGRVCIGAHSGTFVIISVETGELVAKITSTSRIEATCAVYEDFIAFGNFDGVLTVCNLSNGKLVGSVKTEGVIKMTPIFDDEGSVYFGSYDGTIRCKNISSGYELSFDAEGVGSFMASPLIVDNILLAATLSGYVVAFRKVCFMDGGINCHMEKSLSAFYRLC